MDNIFRDDLETAPTASMTPQTKPAKLPREFYLRPDVLTVSRELLGKLLVVPAPDGKRVSGKIVEVEAYRGPEDRASHAYGGRRTKRTETMYRAGGVAYVYFVYGMYYQFNVVSGVVDTPHAILVRALEPIEGIEIMRARRQLHPDHNLTNGPGKLCIAMGIDRGLDGADLIGDRVWLEEYEPVSRRRIARGPRIGIDYAQEWIDKPWRFWIRDNPYVSRYPRKSAAKE
jgi:DNA-3-methyladenine glycosylase